MGIFQGKKMKQNNCDCWTTAVGKTALAIEVAKRFGGEVVSGDSQQVYRGLDIGRLRLVQRSRQLFPII